MKFTNIIPFSGLAAVALSATIDVTVGPGLAYSPSSVTAARGDTVRFTFGSGHNVVSGSYNSPCQPDGVIYSGEPSEGDTFSVAINSTDPIWIYCSVPHHCQGGMAMVINAPSNENITAYKKSASTVSSSGTPDSVVGGVLNAQSSSSSSSSSSASASSSSHSSTSSRSASATSMSGTATMTSASTSSTASASQSSSSSSSSGASKALGSSGSAFCATIVALAVAFGATMQLY